MRPLSRRAALAGALAGGVGTSLAATVAACRAHDERSAPAPREDKGPAPPLRALAPMPMGVCLQTFEIARPDLASQAAFQFSQLTPEWQMKMDYIFRADGSLRFEAPDRLVAFASTHDMGVHGHTLIYYDEQPEALTRLDGRPDAFEAAVKGYIDAVAGRYRGRVAGWDVVNEPLEKDGSGLRRSLYWRNMGGDDYIARSFHYARAADPGAILFLNDADLETNPAKRALYLRLAEGLLRSGAPLQGLGTQTHADVDLPRGAMAACLRDLASLGLPIHVSELDVDLGGASRLDLRPEGPLLQRQARVYGEVVDAFMALPERQRYALTTWGLRDDLSWQRKWNPHARPDLFDARGEPKPAFWAVADRLRAG